MGPPAPAPGDVPVDVPGPRGVLVLERGGRRYEAWGGPYPARPPGMAGVKLAAEIDLPCDVDLPAPDFGCWTEERMREGAAAILGLLAAEGRVYVGCRAGIGRTGTVLAVLAKVFGDPDPVARVRRDYCAEAVETSEQERLVRTFRVGDLAARLDAAPGAARTRDRRPG